MYVSYILYRSKMTAKSPVKNRDFDLPRRFTFYAYYTRGGVDDLGTR